MNIIFLIAGLGVLVAGAELLVRGASGLAQLARISPLVIGLTVVAFGTSAPELAVSTVSSLNGTSSIALGNVIGSNIFNVLLILGLSALIVPLTVASGLIRRDVPLLIIASFAVWGAAYDGVISRIEGLSMLIAFVGYTAWLIYGGQRQTSTDDAAIDTEGSSSTGWKRVVIYVVSVLAGLGLLVLGARWLVDSASVIARGFGVNDLVIGLTIVAGGTSLPELATSIMAAVKGQRDLAVGNVIGSNIFNLLVVLGASATLAANGVPVERAVLLFDMALMVAVACLCWPMFLSQSTVSRGEGLLMLTLYAAYTALLVTGASGWESASIMKSGFLLAVIPLSLIWVSVAALRSSNETTTLM